jgi:hypothetical protein
MADNAAASAAANLCVKNKYVGMWSTLEKKKNINKLWETEK